MPTDGTEILFPYGCLCQREQASKQPISARFKVEKDGRYSPGFSYVRRATVSCRHCGVTWCIEETASFLPDATENPPFTGNKFYWAQSEERDPYQGRYAMRFYVKTCPLCEQSRSYYLRTVTDGDRERVVLDRCMACGNAKPSVSRKR